MKKLLVIRFSALGDVAMVVPIVKALADKYPDWDITMLSRKQYEALFLNLPTNVHFFGADLKGKHRGIAGLNHLLHDINYRDFDVVADLHHVLRSMYLRYRFLLQGKHVAYIHKDRCQKWLFVRHLTPLKHPLQSTISHYQNVLKELGFDFSLQPTHQLTDLPIQPLRNIGIAPFAAHKGKIYPLKQMEEVVRQLGEAMYANGEKVYLFGAGPKESTILQSWQEKYDGVENIAGQYSMDKEIRLISGLRLMITMDSANMHLASLTGTRVLSIWGATHPWCGFIGYGQSINDCIQQNLSCRPCSIYGNKKCKYGDYRCLQIEPSTIIQRTLATITTGE